MDIVWLFTFVFGASTAGITVALLVTFVRAARVAVHGVRAEGRVVAYETDDDGAAYPVVEFTADGAPRRFTAHVNAREGQMPPGHAVRVVCLPWPPFQAWVDSFADVWGPVLALAIGLAVVGSGFAGLVWLHLH